MEIICITFYIISRYFEKEENKYKLHLSRQIALF